MKRALFTALAAGSLMLTATPHAFAAASTQIYHDQMTSFADLNPCTWALGTSTTIATDILHLTHRPDGTVSVAGARTGTISFASSDPSRATYTGHFSQSYGGGGVIDPTTGDLSVGEETATYTVHASATNGSRITYHEVSHQTITPSGMLTVSFDRSVATCS